MSHTSRRGCQAALAIALCLITAIPGLADSERATGPSTTEEIVSKVEVPGLERTVRIRRDQNNVPHIFASSDHDAAFMFGWVHAEDRFFQMDWFRRQFSGTLAELLGQQLLNADIQFQLFGMRRAAEATWDALPPETRDWLQAYSDGVNAQLANADELPEEYEVLELTSVAPWTPIDSLVSLKGITWGLSFNLFDLTRTNVLAAYLQQGQVGGFDGASLFFQDVFRAQPFDTTATVPGFLEARGIAELPAELNVPPKSLPSHLDAGSLELVRNTVEQLRNASPVISQKLEPEVRNGSNWWMATGDVTSSGFPMMANDPHLALVSPPVFYEAHLRVKGAGQSLMNASGVSFAGVPGIVQGCNLWVCWGSTVHTIDVTDVFVEQLVLDSETGLPRASLFEGEEEPLLVFENSFRVNLVGDGEPDNVEPVNVGPLEGGFAGYVPRRNNGPIISVNLANPQAPIGISVQYTGWGPTMEIEALRRMLRSNTLSDVEESLQFFDVGAQNWGIIDRRGRIAYYTAAEVPVREDLQLLETPDGFGPAFVLDGNHAELSEWLPVENPQPNQALPFEILPFSELPQSRNPQRGYLINANNDAVGVLADNNPINQLRPGGGVYYLGIPFAQGFRVGRLQRLFDELLESGRKISYPTLAEFQADHQLLDAEILVPYILTAFANAEASAVPELAALAADPEVAEAVGRFAAWDFSTPTGIAEGYDPGGPPGVEPSQEEIDASVAATIYALWRSQAVRQMVDSPLLRVGLGNAPPFGELSLAVLRHHLDQFDQMQGVGSSGLRFYVVPGVDDPAAARDILLLDSLRDGLDLLASNAFSPAFDRSTQQDDYRWGKLHRIVFNHPSNRADFGIPFSGGFDHFGDLLPGIPRSGGLGVVDSSGHDPRADGLNEFMYFFGAARRFVGQFRSDGSLRADQVLPGGQSGARGDEFQADQLHLWLVNDYHKFLLRPPQVVANQRSVTRFDPP